MNKTTPCKYIVNGQTCPYNRRCRFLHEYKESDVVEGRPASQIGLKSSEKKLSDAKLKPRSHREIDGRDEEKCQTIEEEKIANRKGRPDSWPGKQPSKYADDSRKTRKAVPRCRNFLRSHCKYGDKCKYHHPEKVAPDPITNSDTKPSPSSMSKKHQSLRKHSPSSFVRDPDFEYQKQHSHNPQPLTIGSFISGRVCAQSTQKLPRMQKQILDSNLREVELEQLQTRFPGDSCSLLSKSKDNITYLIHFSPTDPDWHGISIILMEVTFPASYPKKYCFVELSADQELDQEVIVEGNKAIQEYWTPDMLNTLMFRPFLRWWDKNMVKILASFSPLATVVNETTSRDVNDDDANVEVDADDDSVEKKQPLVKSKKGTEIRLLGLVLSQTLGTAFWPTIKIALSCSRCKNQREAEIKEERAYSISCDRCNNVMSVVYHLALIHAASSTMGYLELIRCTPVEIIFQFSSLSVTCLNCSTEIISKGFFIGQPKDTYCRKCHAKVTLSATGVRFIQHQQVDTPANAQTITVLSSSKEAVKNLLKDGQPLPDYGICKHYKKSHRWLRFPCCGRAFPCDVCHDSVQDHPMERANRMLCGYCSKEQDYSGKGICMRCGGDLVSSKRSTHWEGGAGCRNKVKMSRDDKHKYKNSETKTVCKKEQRVGKKTDTS